MNNKVILFLNGEAPITVPDIILYHKVYCTDGAYNYLQKMGIQPDVISGDFDSFSPNFNASDINIIHTPDQNFTDFEKALTIIKNDGYTIVDIYGASGKEQDHFIGNLNTAYKFKNDLQLTFYDNYSTYQFIPKAFKLNNVMNKTISLIPFPTTDHVTTKGLEYPLNNENISLINRISTRNKAIANSIEINYTDGELILFVIK